MRIQDISRVYVVNLARREDRWTTIADAWTKTGVEIPLTRFVACDGQDFEPPKSWDVGRGAYGCYLSHISILAEAIRTGVENFLIFEDDACFASGFADKLASVLADLPDDYDQLYLGWQPLHTDRVPPTRITERLGRAGNCNRNHATLWSRRGAIRFLARLQDLSERQKKHHIDHWMGELHEELDDRGEHAYRCYISIPQIAFQAAGQSDICGKQTPLHKWLYTGTYAQEYPSLVEVRSFNTAFGKIGRRGWLGYEKRRADTTDDANTTVISLHAPSTLAVTVTEPVTISGAMNSTGAAREPVQVTIDGESIGTVQKARDRTKETELDPGDHWLEFFIDKDQNAFAHTYWIIEKRT